MKEKMDKLRQLDSADVRQKIAGLEKELYELRSQSKASRVEKPHRFKQLKKEIARCKTLIREKELINAGKPQR